VRFFQGAVISRDRGKISSVGDYDPIRDRMAAMSDDGLRAVIVDVEGWALEARVAAYGELCRRGITDAPNPATTPIHIERTHDPDAIAGNKGGLGKIGALIFIAVLLWSIFSMLNRTPVDPTQP
jgi:hypothetical protein